MGNLGKIRRHTEAEKLKRLTRGGKMPEIIGATHKEIVGDDELRSQKCMAAIKEICEQYDCVIIPQTIITGAQIQWDLGVFPKPRQPETPKPEKGK